MRFSRLRLLGFKSFVEQSEFVIERGLTGVVGPNGCGKSNLVEALRWVMGESSYKSMRASGMDDVIFSGSATRASRNSAEVTLFLDNSDRAAPSSFNDADELQVSRRIERESGSTYRINGKEARAKDVQLLFADQSTGARSPSMVGQGRIGELIQARPQARRALLEEAAGISGLHSRRHEAELRLRAAEQNLDRLEDVTGELSGQIENLKRQARQAIRFRNLSADIRSAEATLLHLRWAAAKAQEGEAQSALNQATIVVAERAAAQMEAAKAQGIAAHELPGLRDASAAAAATLQRLTIARTQLDEESERIRQRQAELAGRLEQLTADIDHEQRMRADTAGLLARLDEEEARLEAEHASSGDRIEQGDAALGLAGRTLEASEAALGAITARFAEAAAARSQSQKAFAEAEQRRQRLQREASDIEREAQAIAAKLADLPVADDRRRELKEAEANVAEAEKALLDVERRTTVARETELACRPVLAEARAAFTRKETEATTLARVLATGASGDFPAVLDQLSVARGFEAALGAALGEDIDVPVDARAPVHWASMDTLAHDPDLPLGVSSLADHVGAPVQLARRLRQIGVVDQEDGDRLQPLLAAGQSLVTRQGAVWRWDGLTVAADAPTPAAQRLARKNRLAELQAEVATAGSAREAAEQDAARAEAELNASAEQERTARAGLRVVQTKRDAARDALRRAEKASAELVTRRAAIAEAADRIATSHAETERAVAVARDALADGQELSQLEGERDASRATVVADRAALADLRAAFDAMRREAELRSQRLSAIVTERDAWRSRAENADRHLEDLTSRHAQTETERAALAEAPDELSRRRHALQAEIGAAEQRSTETAARLRQAETRQAEFDKSAKAAIEALASAREARGRAEERLTAADDRRREVEARISEVLGVPPHQALTRAGLGPDAALPEIRDVEDRLERLRVERERLGAVNLRAEEEQRELAERLETIVTERDDIIEAIRTLRQAIHGLNKEGRDRLLAAFDVVNVEFQRLFTHLFGGGTAELQLIESEDPLDAGLEIMARPPGKRPQTMTLLSGGEQALTAMALIFAVFLTNPAPICVLDEVDAPLDDHNVERFCNLMDEMAASTETRFIVITHNPITMARMNRLFGVTMAEQGVSQLVSVDLQTAEQLREAG